MQLPWGTATGVQAVLSQWLSSQWVKPCLSADEILGGAPERLAPFPEWLSGPLKRALHARNVHALYSHQAAAIEASYTRQKHVVIATPTASGKSLCFQLPVLQTLLDAPDARALYLFPTKALARDQEASLRALMQDAGLARGAITFDGDTPGDARRAARERAGVLLTNPDMLHTGILPHHTNWARTFQNLRFVVVDELHTYRGVFGSHVANVLRRLRRVASFHGSSPLFISATATIGNPREHAARLFGLRESEVELVDESGAPRGPRRFFLFNPPVVNSELGIRASYAKQAVHLASDLVRAKVPTLVFGQSRNSVETMLRYLRDKVSPDVPPDQVMAYRGGYLPHERRDIERRLREGELLGVVATNALELGIDVGSLDAVICAGYPGSVAATWQRFGRAGRRKEESICVLVTTSAPLDQYLAREPGYLLARGAEEARIDPENAEVVIQHLKCAAFELPFRKGESFGTLGADDTNHALQFLEKHRVVHDTGGSFHWATDAYPAANVSLRSVGWDNVAIIDVARDKCIAELDFRSSHTMLHEQAIYQHDGDCFQVERFDHPNHKAFVRKVAPDYFTDAMTHTKLSILEEAETGTLFRTAFGVGHGEVSVVEKVVGYKKIKFYTHENVGYGEVELPLMQMHTTAFWLTVPESVVATLPGGRAAAIDALSGVGAALETVATLALMCDPRDLGRTLGDTGPVNEAPAERVPGGPRPGYEPALFLYEHVPGGTGLAERVFALREALFPRALRLIEGCACTDGCPACVGPAGEVVPGHTRRGLSLSLLRALVPSA